MVFTPDTDLNFQAYRYFVEGAFTSGLAAGAINPPPKLTGDDLAQFQLALIQWLCLQMTNGVTLVTNGGTAQAPTNSILAALNAAQSVARGGNRGF
jgi:hypothetical protein